MGKQLFIIIILCLSVFFMLNSCLLMLLMDGKYNGHNEYKHHVENVPRDPLAMQRGYVFSAWDKNMNPVGRGHGILVNSHLFITSARLVRGAVKVNIRSFGAGREAEYYADEVIAWDEENDLVCLIAYRERGQNQLYTYISDDLEAWPDVQEFGNSMQLVAHPAFRPALTDAGSKSPANFQEFNADTSVLINGNNYPSSSIFTGTGAISVSELAGSAVLGPDSKFAGVLNYRIENGKETYFLVDSKAIRTLAGNSSLPSESLPSFNMEAGSRKKPAAEGLFAAALDFHYGIDPETPVSAAQSEHCFKAVLKMEPEFDTAMLSMARIAPYPADQRLGKALELARQYPGYTSGMILDYLGLVEKDGDLRRFSRESRSVIDALYSVRRTITSAYGKDNNFPSLYDIRSTAESLYKKGLTTESRRCLDLLADANGAAFIGLHDLDEYLDFAVAVDSKKLISQVLLRGHSFSWRENNRILGRKTKESIVPLLTGSEYSTYSDLKDYSADELNEQAMVTGADARFYTNLFDPEEFIPVEQKSFVTVTNVLEYPAFGNYHKTWFACLLDGKAGFMNISDLLFHGFEYSQMVFGIKKRIENSRYFPGGFYGPDVSEQDMLIDFFCTADADAPDKLTDQIPLYSVDSVSDPPAWFSVTRKYRTHVVSDETGDGNSELVIVFDSGVFFRDKYTHLGFSENYVHAAEEMWFRPANGKLNRILGFVPFYTYHPGADWTEPPATLVRDTEGVLTGIVQQEAFSLDDTPPRLRETLSSALNSASSEGGE